MAATIQAYIVNPIASAFGKAVLSTAETAVTGLKDGKAPVLHPLLTLIQLGILWDRYDEQLKIKFDAHQLQFVTKDAWSTTLDFTRSRDDLIYLEQPIRAVLDMYPPSTLELKIIYYRAYKGLEILFETYASEKNSKMVTKILEDLKKLIKDALDGIETREERINKFVLGKLAELEKLSSSQPNSKEKSSKKDGSKDALSAFAAKMKEEFTALVTHQTLSSEKQKSRQAIHDICGPIMIRGFHNDYELAKEKIRKQNESLPGLKNGKANGTNGNHASESTAATPASAAASPAASSEEADKKLDAALPIDIETIFDPKTVVKIPKEFRAQLESRSVTCLNEFKKIVERAQVEALQFG